LIDDVRMQADIVQVVQETVPLKRVGATYKGLCPFHAEKTPSFHVNRDRGFFHCFGCGAGGDVFKFVELRDRVGFGGTGSTQPRRDPGRPTGGYAAVRDRCPGAPATHRHCAGAPAAGRARGTRLGGSAGTPG
jgi:hypothetical protein